MVGSQGLELDAADPVDDVQPEVAAVALVRGCFDGRLGREQPFFEELADGLTLGRNVGAGSVVDPKLVVNPAKVHVTVPPGARIRRQAPRACAVHRRRLTDHDVTRVEGIPVVTARRGILDGHERGLRADLLDQAITTGHQIGQLTGDELDEIAEARAA